MNGGANKETTMTKTFKNAGKAIGGGKLTHVKVGNAVVGHIVETLGFWFAHNDRSQPGNYVLCHSMEEAKSKF